LTPVLGNAGDLVTIVGLPGFIARAMNGLERIADRKRRVWPVEILSHPDVVMVAPADRKPFTSLMTPVTVGMVSIGTN
jgi:hypothetical protein